MPGVRRAALLRAAAGLKRYYITDRRGITNLRGAGDLVACIRAAAASGVDLIQVREKDLPARELVALVRRAVEAASPYGSRVLVNGRVDVALAAGAHGVHLPGDAIPATEWRRVVPAGFLIGVSCHALADDVSGADLAVFGPVFETPGKGPAVGLARLTEFIRAVEIPVFALGGVTQENAAACAAAGAAGIAAIRMFQQGCSAIDSGV